MALGADCGSSTVLEMMCVTTTPGRPLTSFFLGLATRPSATSPRRLELPGENSELGVDGN